MYRFCAIIRHMTIAESIKYAIAEILADRGIVVSASEVTLEHPADMVHGDYATNVAMVHAKKIGEAPHALAEYIATSLRGKEIEGIADVSVAGLGFINIVLVNHVFVEELGKVAREGSRYGTGDSLTGKKFLIEYTQPNPFKPFHIGHLMSNAIGESIARLVAFAGANVVRANYQGDIGLHVAKAIWGMRALEISADDIDGIGRAYAHGNTQYEEDEQAKKEIVDINTHLYAHDDAETDSLYAEGRKVSLEHFEELYKTLGTRFDAYFFESEVWQEGLATVRAHVGDVFEESDGAIVFPGEKYGLHTRVFVNAAGLPTYEAKEIGLAMKKLAQYPDADRFVITTAVEQEEYFKVIIKVLALIRPDTEGRFEHVSHGMMRLPSGKMSSRTGNVVTGESLLSDVTELAAEKLIENNVSDEGGKIAATVAVAALKYGILRQETGKNIVYDADRWLSFEGDAGPYVQYSAVRARSVVGKAREAGISPDVSVFEGDIGETERLIARFPEIAADAARAYAPHRIVTYLTELAHAFNAYYAQVKIVDDSAEAPYRVALALAVAQTLENGLNLLGIGVPEKM